VSLISGSQVRALVRPPPSLPKPRYLRPASTKAVFAAIFRVWWSPISALCAEISTSGPFGTPVSGGKNPVPNSARQESEGGKLFFAAISRVWWNGEQTAHGSSGPPGLVTRASSRVELPQAKFNGTGAISSYIDSESIRIGCNKACEFVRLGGPRLEASRPDLSIRQVKALDQGQEPEAPRFRSGPGSAQV
jgi:hypothetical protein